MTNISDISFGAGIAESVTASLDSDSLSGHSLLADQFRITSEGHVVKARLGLSIGVRFRLVDLEAETLAYYRLLVTHPLMTNQDTKVVSHGWSEVLVGSNNDWNFTFYTFEYEWELVAGEWAFEYFTLEDIPLAKVVFEVS